MPPGHRRGHRAGHVEPAPLHPGNRAQEARAQTPSFDVKPERLLKTLLSKDFKGLLHGIY